MSVNDAAFAAKMRLDFRGVGTGLIHGRIDKRIPKTDRENTTS
jgi:hypothetical protein